MIDYRSLPDYHLDPPEDPDPPCPYCGLDPACDCEWDDDEPEDDDCGDPYREPFEIDGEDEPIPEDEL